MQNPDLVSNFVWLMWELDKFDPAKPDPNCWIWPWAKKESGHGIVWVPERECIERVNRVVAAKFLGLDLDDEKEYACHKCDNSPCFNPSHLYVGNNMTNKLDQGTRQHRTQCKKGHDPQFYVTRARGGRIFRDCLICHQEQNKLYRQQQKETKSKAANINNNT